MAEPFSLCYIFPGKCILIAGSYRTHWAVSFTSFFLSCFHTLPSSPPLSVSSNLHFHVFYCHSQTLSKICAHLMLDFPSLSIYQKFMTAIKSVLHVPPPDEAHSTYTLIIQRIHFFLCSPVNAACHCLTPGNVLHYLPWSKSHWCKLAT